MCQPRVIEKALNAMDRGVCVAALLSIPNPNKQGMHHFVFIIQTHASVYPFVIILRAINLLHENVNCISERDALLRSRRRLTKKKNRHLRHFSKTTCQPFSVCVCGSRTLTIFNNVSPNPTKQSSCFDFLFYSCSFLPRLPTEIDKDRAKLDK